jgi:hypothetical protein
VREKGYDSSKIAFATKLQKSRNGRCTVTGWMRPYSRKTDAPDALDPRITSTAAAQEVVTALVLVVEAHPNRGG